MVITSIKKGIGLIKKRLRLVVLLYLINLILAALVAVPFFNILFDEIGGTGFGAELSEAFDPILWIEILREIGGDVTQLLKQSLWVIPVLWVWKTAAQVGVIYALHHGAIWPFWRGVGYYTGAGLLLGLMFLPLKLIWITLIYFIAVALEPVLQGEVVFFWVLGVALPVVLLAGLAILELYQRFGRLSIVIGHKKAWRAMRAGFKWPQRYPAAAGIFLAWYAITLLLLVASTALNAQLHVGIQAVWLAVAVQQVFLLARSAVTVGWIGSEVHLYENKSNRQQALPTVKNKETGDKIKKPDITVPS